MMKYRYSRYSHVYGEEEFDTIDDMAKYLARNNCLPSAKARYTGSRPLTNNEVITLNQKLVNYAPAGKELNALLKKRYQLQISHQAMKDMAEVKKRKANLAKRKKRIATTAKEIKQRIRELEKILK